MLEREEREIAMAINLSLESQYIEDHRRSAYVQTSHEVHTHPRTQPTTHRSMQLSRYRNRLHTQRRVTIADAALFAGYCDPAETDFAKL